MASTNEVAPEHDVAHREVMAGLSQKLDGLLGSIPRGSRVVYLDIPLHFNVGDQLINLGVERFFARSAIVPVRRLTLFDVCDVDWTAPTKVRLKPAFVRLMRSIDASHPIALHGGGSLGDLYPELQAMREAVIDAFPERRIVLLPQSLHFDSAEGQRRSLERMLAHPDLHLYLRDRPSVDAVRKLSPSHGSLMPDMAHALWDELAPWRARPHAGTLVLRRRDGESDSGTPSSESFDWDDIITPSDTTIFRLVRRAMMMNLSLRGQLPVRAWYRLRDRVVERSLERFSARSLVETDRLHGTLLACLLARRVRYRDNRYGKLSRYVTDWLAGTGLVRMQGETTPRSEARS